MKVVFLCSSLNFGGAETQLINFATLLKERGSEVSIISMCRPVAFVDEMVAKGIRVHSLDIRRGAIDVGGMIRLLSILKKENPDIFHSHMVHSNFLARLARIFISVPVLISTAHNINEGSWERDWWYRLTDFLCDMTTQVSMVGLKRYVKKKMVNPKKIMFIPNGINLEFFQRNVQAGLTLRQSLGLLDSFVWLAVGRFEKAKDYPNMIKAFSILVAKKPEAILLIAGQGTLFGEIKDLVEHYGLKDKVRFLGVRKDIFLLMSMADAFVISSAWEGTPMVMLEAAACELPIVATNVGGNSEAVKEGESGVLVVPGDFEKLAEAMFGLMVLSLEQRLNMGRLGRAHIQNNYDLRVVTGIWERLYRDLISRRMTNLKCKTQIKK